MEKRLKHEENEYRNQLSAQRSAMLPQIAPGERLGHYNTAPSRNTLELYRREQIMRRQLEAELEQKRMQQRRRGVRTPVVVHPTRYDEGI